MTTLTINEPTSGLMVDAADGGAIVNITYPPCPICNHRNGSAPCVQCQPAGTSIVCLPCRYRGNAPVSIDPPPPDPIIPPVMP